ncbi:MAG: T9SS type A sorting domain-containing protein [Ignavibacteria bacterium]|nr:T9SS type A sorting domain-containing protein [Ignavibacteria bacterium]
MKKFTLFLIFFPLFSTVAQDKFIGQYTNTEVINGQIYYRNVTIPLENFEYSRNNIEAYTPANGNYTGSEIRWFFQDASAICNDAVISANGLYSIAGWALNNKRISLYGNLNNVPLWQFQTAAQGNRNYVSVSDTAGVIALGSYHNFYLFYRNSNVPFFNFDLTTTPDTGTAGPIDITSDGEYFIASANRSDSSWVYCFSKNSTVPLWRLRVGGQIYGIRIAETDSLAIISTYNAYWVVRTVSGTVRAQGPITDGTQMTQGISGNGNYIALVNYKGYLKIYQWNGTTYNLVWQFQEPPGSYYNWVTSVDISYDGTYVAIGTLIFLSSNSYDGRVRYFKISNGSTPLWTYSGLGDEVECVKISKNNKILVAASWGHMNNLKEDLVIFRADPGNGNILFGVNTPGSAFVCDVSDDGTSVIGGGKAVHARTFGAGGTLYNIFVDTTNPVGIKRTSKVVPEKLEVKQNYPNPFNQTTIIEFNIPDFINDNSVSLSVYDVLGREIKNLIKGNLKSGNYKVTFDAGDLPSGVYFYKLTVGENCSVKPMVYLK